MFPMYSTRYYLPVHDWNKTDVFYMCIIQSEKIDIHIIFRHDLAMTATLAGSRGISTGIGLSVHGSIHINWTVSFRQELLGNSRSSGMDGGTY